MSDVLCEHENVAQDIDEVSGQYFTVCEDCGEDMDAYNAAGLAQFHADNWRDSQVSHE